MLGIAARTVACDQPAFEAAIAGASFVHLSEHVAIVGVGSACEVTVESAEAVLRSVEWDGLGEGEPAHRGPLVVGALGYSDSDAARLWIPAQVFGRDVSGYWRTDIGDVAAAVPDPSVRSGRSSAEDVPRLVARHSLPPESTFVDSVSQAVSSIERNELEKVVLARREVLEFAAPINRGGVLANLRVQQPGCVVFAVDEVVGASPELLIRKHGEQFESAPIAGTAGIEHAASLAASAKDLREHEFVVAAMRNAFDGLDATVDSVGEPVVEVLADVAHLITRISGRCTASAFELARGLHHTPAVAGTPTAAALTSQRALEGFDRGIYAGPVGWVDASGNGEWMLALRSAQIEGATATLFTGAGIVAGSDPQEEWNETESKLAPMRRALGV